MLRGKRQRVKDCLTFPLRAVTIFDVDRWGLSSLASERFDYCAREVRGYCLDIGCGRHNRFVNDYLAGCGKGIDVFQYEGLTEEDIIEDLTHLPFRDSSFETVTFIANLNHVPLSERDAELAEAFRCLRQGGNIIVTMGDPLAELLVHQLVRLYDKLLGTKVDVDTERGMGSDEAYYLRDAEIVGRLSRAGFKSISKKPFLTQWGLNALFVGWKL